MYNSPTSENAYQQISKVVLLGVSRKMPKQYLELGHNHFLPHPLQFIHYLPINLLFTAS